jgi:hypothetical protein
LSKVKALAGKPHDLPRQTGVMGCTAGLAAFSGAGPSLRIIFPVKNLFGYCGYSASSTKGSSHFFRDANSRSIRDAYNAPAPHATGPRAVKRTIDEYEMARAGRIVGARKKEGNCCEGCCARVWRAYVTDAGSLDAALIFCSGQGDDAGGSTAG